MGKSGRGAPATLSSKPPFDSDPCLSHNHLSHRRIWSSGTRPRRASSSSSSSYAAASRRSGPATPLLRWKFNDPDRPTKPPPRRRSANASPSPPSARRLAAVMWKLAPLEAGGRARSRSGLEPVALHLQAPYACNPNSQARHGRDAFDGHKFEPAAALPNSAMERATKWDPACAKASDEAYSFCSRPKVLDGQQMTATSFVSALQTELKQTHNRITELEDERQSAKRKMDHLLRKITEEKALWRSKEHEKIRSIVGGMKNDTKRERKNWHQMEIVNSKLVDELTEVKLSAQRFLQDYEKELKVREVMEEVCDELAKEIAEDKTEVEALKRESIQIREEVEEERKMLQMAEVWREERVQMKLIDAKVTLEEKYSQVSKLKVDLEAFLRVRSSGNSDSAELIEAESLREADKSINLRGIDELSYQPPPASEDIFSVFEELRPTEETNEREIEKCYGCNPASHGSKIHTGSPATDVFLEEPTKRYHNRLFDRNGDLDDDSGWETVSQDEEQGTSNSPAGSDPSVNGLCEECNASASGTEWEESGDNGTLNSNNIEVCSLTTRESRKKASSISRLWRSSCPSNGENYKKIIAEAINGRLFNGSIFNVTLSPDKRSGEIGLSPVSAEQWVSPDATNPHITRGMKGCTEWPRGMQKHSLKAKLLEARMESQKIQLRHAIKQKI